MSCNLAPSGIRSALRRFTTPALSERRPTSAPCLMRPLPKTLRMRFSAPPIPIFFRCPNFAKLKLQSAPP